MLSAGDVFLTDLTNAILLVCLAVGDAIHWFTRHRNSLHRNLQFRLFPLLELLDRLLGEVCSSSKSALAALTIPFSFISLAMALDLGLNPLAQLWSLRDIVERF